MKNDISTLIEETIKSIQQGLPEGFEITDDIQFEVQVITNKTSKGGMVIKLVSAGSEKQEHLTQKIKFEVAPIIDKEKKMTNDLKAFEGLISKAVAVYDNVKPLFEGKSVNKSES
ncbi:hypothetical protein [Arcticibacterium luteifluviistationis]|uniref:Uncharacterized protein n=1 Tax=Arcticibacterium luteifluviistationis TaxID=1784714 RepID=A0A2Z4GBI0_9BACT|nr:hypothetical protein [Arcticibacterium luteifluviistationis]AWV98481.1 hypothetical protein DJ013_09980 [Arcticibacterium luteifluviistationis]